MAARCNETIDAMIVRWGNLLPPNDTTTFTRTYLPTILDAEFVANISSVGRQVYAVPLDYSQVEFASRAQDLNAYPVGVLVVNRYTDAGAIPDAWIDDQVEWVEKIIWNPLQNMRRDPLLGSLWSHNAKVDLVYRVDYLQQNKLFWSEVTFEFHEIAG